MTTQEYRTQSYENWQRVAANWERRRAEQWRTTEPVSRNLVERLALRRGDTVLELAAGHRPDRPAGGRGDRPRGAT